MRFRIFRGLRKGRKMFWICWGLKIFLRRRFSLKSLVNSQMFKRRLRTMILIIGLGTLRTLFIIKGRLRPNNSNRIINTESTLFHKDKTFLVQRSCLANLDQRRARIPLSKEMKRKLMTLKNTFLTQERTWDMSIT